jgi:hypothetical protein
MPKLEALRDMTLIIVRNRGHVSQEELRRSIQQDMAKDSFGYHLRLVS